MLIPNAELRRDTKQIPNTQCWIRELRHVPAPLSSDTLRHSLNVDRTIRENSKDNSNRFKIHYRWNGNDMLQWCRDTLKDVIFSPPLNVRLLCFWSRKYIIQSRTKSDQNSTSNIDTHFIYFPTFNDKLNFFTDDKLFNQKSMVRIFKNLFNMWHTIRAYFCVEPISFFSIVIVYKSSPMHPPLI